MRLVTPATGFSSIADNVSEAARRGTTSKRQGRPLGRPRCCATRRRQPGKRDGGTDARELDEFDTAVLPLQRVLPRAGLGGPDHGITVLLSAGMIMRAADTCSKSRSNGVGSCWAEAVLLDARMQWLRRAPQIQITDFSRIGTMGVALSTCVTSDAST
jgi:hypothetical protein